MNENDIEVGDIVSIHFTTSRSLSYVKVLYLPQATGDCWRLSSTMGRTVINYVQIFERMELERKGEEM